MARGGVARIYVLSDPITGEIRYVGWTVRDLSARLKSHIKESLIRGRKNRKSTWVFSLNTRGYSPNITLVQEVPPEFWKEAEVYWISYFRSIGCSLVNGTTGGEGTPGHYVSPSVRNQNSQLHKGKTISPEQKLAIGEAAKRRWAKWRAEGSVTSEETRNRLRAAQLGKKATDETRLKLSQSRKGRPKSPEHRESIRAALAGKSKSPEHREKILMNLQQNRRV
jgi:hypothetical protein